MALIYLIRHARACADWDTEADPGLDPLGREQAAALVARFAPLAPLPVVLSPMRRARETAAPLLAHWDVLPRIEPRVSELPAPAETPGGRSAYLSAIASRRYAELDGWLRAWRQGVVDALLELAESTVVVTHFVAINAALGAAIGDDRVVHFRPNHCSVTVLRRIGSALRPVTQGAQAQTRVL